MLIVFDLDDTLVDTTGSISPYFLSLAFKRMTDDGLVSTKEKKLLELNSISESSKAAIKIFLEQENADPFYFPIGVAALSEPLPHELKVKVVNGAYEMLTKLSQSYRLALVTFGEENRQKQKWEKAGIDGRLFCKIVYSKHENKEFIYKELLEELRLPADQCIVVGDRPKGDLSGAKRLGMWTIHMKWGRGVRAKTDPDWVDFEVGNLLELQDKVEEITKWQIRIKSIQE